MYKCRAQIDWGSDVSALAIEAKSLVMRSADELLRQS